MRADTHDGPEQMLHVRGLIHCCSSHVHRSWNSVLQRTAGPYIMARLRRAVTARHVRSLGRSGQGDSALEMTRLTLSGRWMFGRIFGLDGRESYRELRLELLCCPHRLSRGTAPHEREYPRRKGRF